ncbi:MAG: nickel-dependent hydrogenase large subunit [Candidatus Melainabacteria bacterium]|nr:nickel-dependent hydrogenase large subunit [Candidatus Melainabacteria bacterium]
MTEQERKSIHIPEICRVEGHSAVHVDIAGGKVTNVTLDVFEGTRFFERIVVGHHCEEIPHITSRVCAICSTGHVLAATFALEKILEFTPTDLTSLLRELMHLGMIIESHATHIYALALPDYLKVGDLLEFATKHTAEFEVWTQLRNLGASIQTIIGGRPFHPVNLHVGGLTKYPSSEELEPLRHEVSKAKDLALQTCDMLLGFRPPVARTTSPVFLALKPYDTKYGFFGDTIQSTDGWEDSIENYRQYLGEVAVPYSHAKRSAARSKPLMVGAMARLMLFGQRLGRNARAVYTASALYEGDSNSLWNNLAQAIEIVEAIEQAETIIDSLLTKLPGSHSHTPALMPGCIEEFGGGLHPGQTGLKDPALKGGVSVKRDDKIRPSIRAGQAAGAVECPRGTLYHFYVLDDQGHIVAADMITPSAQNTFRIELDIREIVSQSQAAEPATLQANLEMLVRAYDPCNTCATHMVSIAYK